MVDITAIISTVISTLGLVGNTLYQRKTYSRNVEQAAVKEELRVSKAREKELEEMNAKLVKAAVDQDRADKEMRKVIADQAMIIDCLKRGKWSMVRFDPEAEAE